jgi:hypothetical protein
VNDLFAYREQPRGSARGAAWAAFHSAGGIGWYDDVDVVIGHGDSAGRPMTATARPTSVEPIEGGGLFALRHFELRDPGDWDEFLALSVEAWPEFESTNDARIEGLFRFADVDDEALLVTRYPSLAGWESSRTSIRPDNAAGRNFLRRRELTRRSVVRTAGSFWTA